MFIRQIKTGFLDVFTYIIGCEKTKIAAVIDPGGDAELIAEEAKKAGFTVRYIINTHGHSDHTAGNRDLIKLTSARVVMHRLEPGSRAVDIALGDETEFAVGTISLRIYHTPGHTPGGICLYAEGNLFTGDTLFVGDSGRTDLAGGDRKALGASIRMLMNDLPDQTVVWPGHDYGPTPSSTLGWEKRHNVNAEEYGFYTGR
jgi:glyoxylase-like metal-dependent hydrolase (beta-lactamase superfamily II)